VVSVAHEPVGVDVERMDRRTETVRLAERYFAPSEVRALRALPAAEQPRRFFAYWTLKESYIKARGLGLALPLDQFAFHLDDEAIRIAFDPRLVDNPARWRFALLDAPPCYTLTVGVDTGGAPLSLRAAPVVPLRG
jgi:4'-phosphopantetheinyl transferase